ncbi:hypothetical protein Pelo_2826 [Pelomyxa schiedti]|nr:hypothetical protein Pelo_2826 [Pelomyxa schiedti]
METSELSVFPGSVASTSNDTASSDPFDSNWSNPLVGGIGVGVYTCMLVACCLCGVWSNYKTKKLLLSVSNFFYLSLATLCILRIVWFALHIVEQGDHWYTYLLGSLALSVFFTNFTLIITFWAEQYRFTYCNPNSTVFLPHLKWIFIISNAVIYIFAIMAVFLNIYLTLPYLSEFPFFRLVFTTVMAIILLALGFKLLQQQRKSLWYDPDRMREIRKIIVTVSIFVIFFLTQLVVALIPANIYFFPSLLYYFLEYWLPEIVVSVTQLVLLSTYRNIEKEDKDFVERLWSDQSGQY